jgi:lipoyl(octanoyl) transferase
MEWKITPGLTEYPDALAVMKAHVEAIQAEHADELAWLVEHPPLYTLGTSAKATDVLSAQSLPTFETGRGGQVTYHGPGQQVVYLMRDLKKHAGESGPDIRAYVKDLEAWIILTLAEFGVEGFIREGRVGVWVNVDAERRRREAFHGEPLAAGVSEAKGGQAPLLMNHNEAKSAALGVRVQKWVTSHGIAINVNPDLSHYAGIVPCGIREFGVTSLVALGVEVSMDEVRAALRKHYDTIFG